MMLDVRVGDAHLREIIFPIPVPQLSGQTVAPSQLARPLDGVDHILSHLRLVLLLLCAGGHRRWPRRWAGSPPAGCWRRWPRSPRPPSTSARPRTSAAGSRVHADDEVGQLAARFNAMLERLEGSRAALDESVRAQRQLVADASHELRTPVTSLRTNIEVLLAGAELAAEDRRRLLADVVEQSEELTALVGDLIELARGDLPGRDTEDVRLDRVVEESRGPRAAQRAGHRVRRARWSR